MKTKIEGQSTPRPSGEGPVKGLSGFAKRATADRHKMGAVAIALAALGRAGNVYNECKGSGYYYDNYSTKENYAAGRSGVSDGMPGPPDTRTTRRVQLHRTSPACAAGGARLRLDMSHSHDRSRAERAASTPFAKVILARQSHLGAGMAVAQSSSLSFSCGTSNGGPIHSPEESKL